MTRFFVPGTPITQGSKRAFRTKRGGINIVEDRHDELQPWRDAVAWNARATRTRIPAGVPVEVSLEFVLPRPKDHFGTGRNAGKLRPSAPHYATKKPDLDKLERAVFDGLTASGIYHDDAQVVVSYTSKVYAGDGADGPGVWVGIESLLRKEPL